MNVEQIKRITAPMATRLDPLSPGTAMRMAWRWTAMDLWATRNFNQKPGEVRAAYGRHLTDAWAAVRGMRENYAQIARAQAEHGPRLESLRGDMKRLQSKTCDYNRSQRMAQDVEAEIRNIIEGA